jgi:hypothetical protein
MNLARELSSDNPAALDDLIGVAEPRVRGMIESIQLQKDVAANKYDQAMARVSIIARISDFPYDAATKLMLALPPERESDRRAIFMWAMENYRQAADDIPRHEDFATMIVRYWKHFPPELISDAIDEVLKRDKKQSEVIVSPSITIATSKGEGNFSSRYQYRLFQFLPILREIDPGKAKGLLRDNTALSSTLKDFPEGLRSLDPSMTDSESDGDGTNHKFSIAYNLRKSDDPAILDEFKEQRQVVETMKGAANDPKEELKRAATLSEKLDRFQNGSPKVTVFLTIAGKWWRTNPDTAREALSQVITLTTGYEPISRSNYLLMATAIYLRMGETAAASKLLEEAVEIAKKFYQTDTDKDRPNLAFKLDWPSAAAWRALAVLSSKLSLPESLQRLSKLPDDDIRVSAEVTLANSILGTPLPYNTVREKFTVKYPGSYRGLPIPALSDLPVRWESSPLKLATF